MVLGGDPTKIIKRIGSTDRIDFWNSNKDYLTITKFFIGFGEETQTTRSNEWLQQCMHYPWVSRPQLHTLGWTPKLNRQRFPDSLSKVEERNKIK